TATRSVSALTVGTHPLSAVYNGDTNYTGSSASLSGGQVVNKADTSTSVGSSPNPSTAGQVVTVTATITPTAPGAGTPGGTVQFSLDGSSWGGPVTVTGGTAVRSAAMSQNVSGHPITATYSGDSGYNGSTGTLPGGQIVTSAPIHPRVLVVRQFRESGP